MVYELMQTGEQSGQTAEMAERGARVLDEEASDSMNKAATIIPLLLYFYAGEVATCAATADTINVFTTRMH